MMVASEAEEAWCPPTFTPSTFSRRWLAWWMVQLASHSTFFSSSPRIASSFALGLVSAPSAIGTIFTALRGEAKSAEAANLGEPLGTSARKADKSACAAYFCVDSRNENLPEKCIHQNYASRPGGSCCRFLLRACERRRCGFGWGLKGTTWGFQTEAYLVWPAHIPQPSVVEVGRRRCVPCFRSVIYREPYNFSVFPWIECASGDGIAAHGASSYGARRTWRQAAGRSAILGPGLGFAGGDGLGWSTASVNQYSSSWPQPSSAGRAGCGLHSALSDGQTSRTWK